MDQNKMEQLKDVQFWLAIMIMNMAVSTAVAIASWGEAYAKAIWIVTMISGGLAAGVALFLVWQQRDEAK
jgi:hypothetical protein